MNNEPVAYWRIPKIENEESFVAFSPSDNSNFENIPLYTKEQLQPRLKMTQVEFDEFSKLSLSSAVTVYEAMDTVYKDKGEINDFSHLYQRLFNRNDKVELEKQIEFSNLWVNFNREKPEEMIEIIPEKEWFIETKNVTSDYRFVKIEFENKSVYNKSLKIYATHFKTKSQAESWVNPLTKAVLLPVED